MSGSVEILEVEQLSELLWRVRWADLGEGVEYRVYQDGVLLGSTTQLEMEVTTSPGESLVLDVRDDDSPPVGVVVPSRVVLRWPALDWAVAYRVYSKGIPAGAAGGSSTQGFGGAEIGPPWPEGSGATSPPEEGGFTAADWSLEGEVDVPEWMSASLPTGVYGFRVVGVTEDGVAGAPWEQELFVVRRPGPLDGVEVDVVGGGVTVGPA